MKFKSWLQAAESQTTFLVCLVNEVKDSSDRKQLRLGAAGSPVSQQPTFDMRLVSN